MAEMKRTPPAMPTPRPTLRPVLEELAVGGALALGADEEDGWMVEMYSTTVGTDADDTLKLAVGV